MIEERYYCPVSGSYRNKYAKLYVMGNGTASVSIIGGGNEWFPCQQDAARWLFRNGFRRA